MIDQHPENLSKLQTTFKKLVWEGRENNPAEVPAYLKESTPIDWKTRVWIYQYAVKERIIESLEEDFETTKKVMGGEKFRAAMEGYLKVFPSKYASLAEVSKNVPEFLKTYPEKFLSELADMEWKLIKASLSENLLANNLTDLQKEEFQGKDIVFVLHPSVELVKFEFPVQDFFEGTKKTVSPKITHLVIFQRERSGVYEEIEEMEWLLLNEIQKKNPLSTLNQFVEKNNIAPEKLGEYFTKWSSLGLIAGFTQV